MIDLDSHHYLSLPQQAIAVPKALRLPLYLRIIFTILSVNVILVMVWLALARTPALPQNPFASYEDVFPGQPWSINLANHFSCVETPIPSVADVHQLCVFHPQTGPFSQVNLIILDGIIFQLNLDVRENSLVLGDILLWWGQSELEWGHERLLLDLPDRRLRAVGQPLDGRITHFTPVRFVYLTVGAFQLSASTDHRIQFH